jgi:hypothetical protein
MRLAVGVALAILGLAAACSEETIVLARVDDGDAGRSGKLTKVRCTIGAAECPTGDFCDLDHTDPPSGKCDHPPIDCREKDFDPVCADDGITYFNDCYRRQARRSRVYDGECASEIAVHCALNQPCPAGATCELLAGGSPGGSYCGPPGGHCWGLIDRPCNDDGLGFRWDECSTEPNALRCVSSCTAIMSGRAFAKAAFNCHP